MHTFTVGGTIRFAWETFKKRPFVLIGIYAVAMLVSVIVSSVFNTENMEPLSPLAIIFALISVVLGVLIEMGIVTFAIRAHDNVQAVGLGDLWNPKPFWRYLGGQILVGLIVMVGLILLIVPGIIAAIALFATSYLIVDKNMGPIEAIKASYHMTKGHRFTLFLLVLAVVGINIIGFLLALVGLLVTIPLSMIAMVHAYRSLGKYVDERHIRKAEESIAMS